MDKLKIIKGMGKCKQGACSDCPYYDYEDDCMDMLEKDMEALLADMQEKIRVLSDNVDYFRDAANKRVPVVRCKDCVYGAVHYANSIFGLPLYYCKHIRNIGRDGLEIHGEDWYCADGERIKIKLEDK